MKKFETKTGLISYFLTGARRYYLLSICFAMLVSLMDMINPRIISFAVDVVIDPQKTPLSGLTLRIVRSAGGIEVLRAKLWIAALAAAVTGALAAVFRFTFRICNAKGSELFVRRMRNELFGKILLMKRSWMEENSTGDLIQRCTSDVQTIKRFVSEQLVALVRTIILLIMTFAFMIPISLEVTAANALFIPVIVGYSLFFHTRIAGAFEKADTEEGKLSAIAQENLTGVRVVRAFGMEIYERERFKAQNKTYTAYWIHLLKLLSLFWSSGDLLTGLQMLTVTVLGSVLCIRGNISTGEFIALFSYTLLLSWPVRMLGRVISEMSKAGISIDRLRYIMNADPETDDEEALQPPMNKDIVFDHVSFAYPGSKEPVLTDVSFTIPAGRCVGILGGTGAGKSTLMMLLERMYELPEGQGTITIGGVDIRKIRRSWLRDHIGIVLQEPYLFSRTLEENISISLPSPDPAAVREAARRAAIDDAIESFTDGYDTFVGERGVTLSGGQKQRTAIAQLLVRKTPVMIFDDSLSAVDARTDARIRHALQEDAGRTTMVLIAHRITTLMYADKIIVLENGRLTQSGTHAQLISEDGLYKRIYELQTAQGEANEERKE